MASHKCLRFTAPRGHVLSRRQFLPFFLCVCCLTLKSVNTVCISPLKVIIFLHLLLWDGDHISGSKSANIDWESHWLAASTGSMVRKSPSSQIGMTLFATSQLVIRVLHILEAIFFFSAKGAQSILSQINNGNVCIDCHCCSRLILRWN